MTIEKENFLRTRLVPLIQRIHPETAPAWGKMSLQQMVEHLAYDALRNANGQLVFEKINTPPDKLALYREFLFSDKPFRENTRNPLMPEDPVPLRHKTLPAAIGVLQEELICFFEVFGNNPQLQTRNPIFGDLDFEQNVQLLHKHALHHLRQFGVEVPSAY